ncbi:cholesterol 24-hydroxylase-like [Patiria miniata]|uniref:Cholesterol 24-hydroxylase n=1 Tax=Patiria miniata TaxID=46514 RepID=A0A914B9G8_PATMI|nr:cholesterol 24-hydroxylase-like [Patiria miniata]
MDMSVVAVLLVGVAGVLTMCVLCGFLACVLYLHYLHEKYAHIPASPRKGFFSGHQRIWGGFRKQNRCFDDMLLDMMRECGSVFHVFIYFVPFVIVLEADFVREMLCKNDHRKPLAFYRDLMKVCGTRFVGSGLVTQLDPIKHAKRRAMFNPAFHRKYLQSLMGQFNAGADVLVEKLSQKADGKTEVAMLDELNRATLDVIAKVAFDLELKREPDGDYPLYRAMKTILKGMSASYENSFIELSPFAADRQLRREVRQAIHVIRELGRECIEGRRDAIQRGQTVPQDILTYILEETKGLSAEESIPMEDMIDEFTTFFLAGQETTANLLSFTLLELGNHPDVLHRVRTEVQAVVGEGRVEYEDINKLDYMMQVLKETLRLWPPATVTSREMSYDVTVNGFKIPAKTSVVTSTYVMARMEKYFHNPLEFDPDRFKISETRPGSYIPFSLGSRSCIGQQFALIEARVLLAKLLQKFNFTLLPGQEHALLEDITLKPKYGCKNYITLLE